MLEAAAGFKGSPSDVTAQLDKAVEQGLNTVRAFAFGTEEGFGLQKKPGQYDEATFKALDFVLDEARKRGLRLVLAVANNWPSANTDEKRRSGANTDNKFAYADAVGAIKIVNGRVVGEDAFFTDPKAKQAYKDHLSVLANRVNSINGRKYKGKRGEKAFERREKKKRRRRVFISFSLSTLTHYQPLPFFFLHITALPPQ